MNESAEFEQARRARLAEINASPQGRQALEAAHGQVWDAQGLARDFLVLGFLAPFFVVRRLADGVLGSLEFQHEPRFYFNFEPDDEVRAGVTWTSSRRSRCRSPGGG
jgi:hypothetical protein